MKTQKKIINFRKNDDAVLGLPIRLTVSVIIGTFVLIALLSYILNPCMFPEKMIISVTPAVTILPGSDPENVTLIISVRSKNGDPISGSSVIIKGLGGAGSGFSDEKGEASVTLRVQLQNGIYEGYLDVCVNAACFERFEHIEMIKVVKAS